MSRAKLWFARLFSSEETAVLTAEGQRFLDLGATMASKRVGKLNTSGRISVEAKRLLEQMAERSAISQAAMLEQAIREKATRGLFLCTCPPAGLFEAATMVLLDCGEEDLRQLGDPYLMELARGLQEALLDSGYGPVLNATRRTLQSLVASEVIHGVILAFGAERPLLAEEIARRGTPCVAVMHTPFEGIPGVGWVYLNLESGAREAARMLVGHGHRRIGFIGNFEDDIVRVSFVRELRAAGVPLEPELEVIPGAGKVAIEAPREAGARAIRELLSLPEPPTAVFARTDVLASGALQAARELGVRVPEDLSLVGHDDTPLAKRAGLTTVRIDCAQLGRAAARVLTSLRQEGSAGSTTQIVLTQVIERSTVSRRET
jgi:DNA-binding LacI/PurR family transcriptional regulator